MRLRLSLALCVVFAPAHALGQGVSADAIANEIAAFVAAGASADDEALVVARDALARCRADLAAHKPADARRRCTLASAALALARERAELALARARRTP